MPPSLRSAMENVIGMELTAALDQYWNLLVLACILYGLYTVISTLYSAYKRYRYNRPDLMDGFWVKLVSGILLININWVVLAVTEFAT